MAGTWKAASELGDCEPVSTVEDLWPNQQYNKKLVKLDGTAPAIPCGLVAKSFFNDSFSLYSESADGAQTQITIVDDNIAWSSDMAYKFSNIDVAAMEDKSGLPAGATTWEDIQWWDMQD